MKTSNSKSTIKAIEKKRDFHTSHAECPKKFKRDGREEVETLYIRSSMEGEEQEEEVLHPHLPSEGYGKRLADASEVLSAEGDG